jgi:proteic killer suppression protein
LSDGYGASLTGAGHLPGFLFFELISDKVFTQKVNKIMEVTFADDRLKRACESASERQRKWGDPAAKNCKTRLDDLHAAKSMEDMRHLPGRWEELAGDRAGHFSCRLNKSLRLIVCPTRQPPPRKEDGGLDWSQIDQVTVTEVVDYHD